MSELSFWVLRHVQKGGSAWSDGAPWYCELLQIALDEFSDQVVVDIGCGPVASLHSFRAKLKIGIDVLARSYQPLGILAHDMMYLAAPAEDLPFVDGFVDAIVSVNGLDHVDDFDAAIEEIHRVLKARGRAFLAFNLQHEPTIQEPHLLTQGRVLEALSGKFEIERAFVSRLIPKWDPNWEKSAPGGVFVVYGRKVAGTDSLYRKQTNDLLLRLSRPETTLEELDLEYALRYGAPAHITAERAGANAFIEYKRRTKGWERRLLRDCLIAVRHQPRMLFDRGILAISLRAIRSALGLKG